MLEEAVEIEAAPAPWPSLLPEIDGARVDLGSERLARNELRRQIARLERRLGELFVSSFPRRGIDWTVGAAGGPRILGLAELERVRDSLVGRLAEAQDEVARRGATEERNRELLEAVLAEPERYHWVQISNEDIGEPGCRHWHSRPRWGPLGMLMGWWRVKVSSGCPLFTRVAPAPLLDEPQAA